LLLNDCFAPPSLQRNDLCCYIVAVHFWHLDVGKHKFEHAVATRFVEALLEALDRLLAFLKKL
jgi:hypothetical protein